MLPFFTVLMAVTGPFCGVSVDNILDKPMFVRETIIEMDAAQIAKEAAGATLEEHDGEAVAVTGEGFSITRNLDLPSGRVSVEVEANASGRGADSYWITFDGEQIEEPLRLSVDRMGLSNIVIDVAEAGTHELKVALREAPGSLLKTLAVSVLTTRVPLPPLREELKGMHPRMFITPQDIPRLRILKDTERARRLYVPAGKLTRKPPAYEPGKRNGGAFVALPNYALEYLLQPDEEQLQAILEWLEMATTYGSVGVDLDAEYFLEGVALTYDWLYDEIPVELRNRVKDQIVSKCRLLFQASLAGLPGGAQQFQQNHYWFAHLALAFGAAAVYDEVPEAERWLAWAWDRYERIALTFSPDGAFHEGPGYWDYSMTTLYAFTDLYEECTGLAIPAGNDGLHGQAQFRFNYTYPGLKQTAAMEDTKVSNGLPKLENVLWEAKRFQDPIVMGIADLIASPGLGKWRLLWLDDDLEALVPEFVLPLAKYYPDVETAFARTSWADDATYIAFVSRPLGGHNYAELCDKYNLTGTGHNHPEQNHFVLYGRGEVLAGDPGYTYEKTTRNHNTVLVDGKGQYGDGEMWPRPTPGRAHITNFATEGDITVVTGDATSAYPEELGLTKFERTMVVAGADLVVCYDQLEAKEPRTFSWLLHHWGEVSGEGNNRVITRNDAQLSVTALAPENVEILCETYRPQFVHPTRDHTPDEADINLLEIKTGLVDHTTFLIPMWVGGQGDLIRPVERIGDDNFDGVRAGQTVVTFRRGNAAMSVPVPWGGKISSSAQVLVARVKNGVPQVFEAP